jgi:hypothetical protein
LTSRCADTFRNEIPGLRKFDAVIVDCDDLQDGLSVLEGLRKGQVTELGHFAILNGSTTTRKAFELGANFVLQKPISPTNAMRCFGAALSFGGEQRRYFRHPIELPIMIVFAQGQELKATNNINEWDGDSGYGQAAENQSQRYLYVARRQPGSQSKTDLLGPMVRDVLACVSWRCRRAQENLEHWLAQHMYKSTRARMAPARFLF